MGCGHFLHRILPVSVSESTPRIRGLSTERQSCLLAGTCRAAGGVGELAVGNSLAFRQGGEPGAGGKLPGPGSGQEVCCQAAGALRCGGERAGTRILSPERGLTVALTSLLRLLLPPSRGPLRVLPLCTEFCTAVSACYLSGMGGVPEGSESRFSVNSFETLRREEQKDGGREALSRGAVPCCCPRPWTRWLEGAARQEAAADSRRLARPAPAAWWGGSGGAFFVCVPSSEPGDAYFSNIS